MARPEKIYLLASEFVMEWPGYAEKFTLSEYRDDGTGYLYSADVDTFDIRDFGSPEELLFKLEIRGYSPCFKNFSRSGYGGCDLPYEVVDGMLAEKERRREPGHEA